MQQERERPYYIHPRLKNCRFKVGSRIGGERCTESLSQPSFIALQCFPDLMVSCKLHLVIKSVVSQCQRPPSHFPPSPLQFFFPLLLFLSGCTSLGSETAVFVTLERSTRKAPAVGSTRVSFCLYGNLTEES